LGAYLGPAKPWTDARTSYLRALRARRLALPSTGAVCDTEQHLTTLVVGADPAALADLRAQVLAPLAALRAPSADRLTETLREWLGRRGRRDDIAAALHVHPQTVRYRMSQLRELYGERLDDPQLLTALTIALNAPADQSPAQS
jgi:DNA-binding PucR family transcriptional regulator